MPSPVLLAINCQQDRSYANRQTLRALYGDRFPDLVFLVGSTCPIDPDFPTIATDWTPRRTDNLCACCDPRSDRHPSGRHATHPRLVQLARYAEEHGYQSVLFVEDDCLLAPSWTPETVLDRGEAFDALVPYLGFCDRDDPSWCWTNHPTGYPAFDRVADRFDRPKMLRNASIHNGEPAPPVLYTPLFGGFVDILIFRVETLRKIAPDLTLLQDVWHEIAIPTALIHRTPRIGHLPGLPLWGGDRNRPFAELFGLLKRHEYVHPIKLSYLLQGEAISLYP